MPLKTRTIEAPTVAEVFITAVPSANLPVEGQAEEVFTGIRAALEARGACLLHDRVFAAPEAMASLTAVRARAYGSLDDGVPPTRLVVPAGTTGALAGVQAYGVRGAGVPEVVELAGRPCGRMVSLNGSRYVVLAGISAVEAGARVAQATAIFAKADQALRAVGGSMQCVVRTWMWLGDILSWYRRFNQVRTRCFEVQGLMQDARHHRLPASTGVGIAPADGAACALDLFARIGVSGDVGILQAGGDQRSPLVYGSAFSRASRVRTAAGDTVFVSGTAAIDPRGATEHVGDADAQIDATLRHVRAVLRDMACDDRHVVQAIAYCKTAAVERAVRAMSETCPWPWIPVICDLCRPDLLFEVEVTACRHLRRHAPQHAAL